MDHTPFIIVTVALGTPDLGAGAEVAAGAGIAVAAAGTEVADAAGVGVAVAELPQDTAKTIIDITIPQRILL